MGSHIITPDWAIIVENSLQCYTIYGTFKYIASNTLLKTTTLISVWNPDMAHIDQDNLWENLINMVS